MLFPLVLFSFVALLGFSEEQATNSTAAGAQTCYNFDGTPFADNVQCPGSSVCCGSLNQCVSQRFCERDGDLIRPVCTTYPWNSDECSGLCLYEKNNGILPRVTKCPDGSFCCDNDPSCCSKKIGVVLDKNGEVVSTNSGTATTSSTRSSSTSTSSATATTTTSSSSSSQSTPTTPGTLLPASTLTSTSSSSSSSSSLSSGAIAGIVVAIVVVVLGLLAVLAFFCLRRRKQQRAYSQTRAVPYTNGGYMPGKYQEQQQPGYQGYGGQSEAAKLQGHQMEMAQERRRGVSEMPGDGMRRVPPAELSG